MDRKSTYIPYWSNANTALDKQNITQTTANLNFVVALGRIFCHHLIEETCFLIRNGVQNVGIGEVGSYPSFSLNFEVMVPQNAEPNDFKGHVIHSAVVREPSFPSQFLHHRFIFM